MSLCLLSAEAVKSSRLACSSSVSASRKDGLWKLQSNSCNYLQSVDNQRLAERLLAHKQRRGARKKYLRERKGKNGGDASFRIRQRGCEKHKHKRSFADVKWLLSLQFSVSDQMLLASPKHPSVYLYSSFQDVPKNFCIKETHNQKIK